jgi:hypothetical protein
MLYLELLSLDCPFFISSSVFSNIYFRHDASLRHIILISSQLIFALSLECSAMSIGEQTHVSSVAIVISNQEMDFLNHKIVHLYSTTHTETYISWLTWCQYSVYNVEQHVFLIAAD